MRAIAVLLLAGCTALPTDTQPDPVCTTVLVTMYGDTARIDDYSGPEPANLTGVLDWWTEGECEKMMKSRTRT